MDYLLLDGFTINVSYYFTEYFQEKPNSVVFQDKYISKFDSNSTEINILVFKAGYLHSNVGRTVATEKEMDQLSVENERQQMGYLERRKFIRCDIFQI